MNSKEFYKACGYYPKEDDLERANCEKAGSPGHRRCGVCEFSGKPKFLCCCHECLNCPPVYPWRNE